LSIFLLTIVLSALLRFTASDYPFGIFKFSAEKDHIVDITEKSIWRYYICRPYRRL